MQTSRIRFFVGDFLVEPRLNRISGETTSTVVEPKVMQVLICLADRPGEVLSKDALLDEVWEGIVVTDYVVSRSISQLRKIFGDSFRDPVYIETVSKTGYRLIASVSFDAHRTESFAGYRHGDSQPEPAESIEIVPGAHTVVKRPVQSVRRRLSWKTAILIALATATLAWIGGALSTSSPDQPLSATLFTSTSGIEIYPTFSPDGSMVAFLRYNEGHRYDLYLKMIGGDTELRLTSDPAADLYPNWTPDGRHIVFERVTPESCGIYQIPALGGSARKLMDCGLAQRDLSRSPDGTSFLVAEVADSASGLRIVSIDASTQKRTSLTNPPPANSDFLPVYSPDGKQIAFCRGPRGEVADLYVMPARGGTPRRLTHDERNIARFTWTPDGRALLFSSNRTGDYRLWRVDTGSGDLEWVSNVATLDPGGPAMSPAGDYLAYEEWVFEINIWEVEVATAKEPAKGEADLERRFASTRWDFQPHYAPDGERVAFVSNRSGRPELWVGARDGSDASSLASLDGAYLRMPRWSPDASWIAFEGFSDGHSTIFTVDSEGGPPQKLSAGAFEHRAPAWSEDGTWIYFASNREDGWQIWKMPANGGSPVRVTRHGGYGPQVSADGTLYYTKPGQAGLWLWRNGSEELVIAGLQQIDWGNWTIGATGIYLFERKGSDIHLVRYTLDGHPSEAIAAFPASSISHEPGITVSPDESRLLLTRVDRAESDIVLVDWLTR